MDLEYDPDWMDICSPRGFILAMYAVLTTRKGGGCTLAPVCSSWVFVPLACGYLAAFLVSPMKVKNYHHRMTNRE